MGLRVWRTRVVIGFGCVQWPWGAMCDFVLATRFSLVDGCFSNASDPDTTWIEFGVDVFESGSSNSGVWSIVWIRSWCGGGGGGGGGDVVVVVWWCGRGEMVVMVAHVLSRSVLH